MSIKKVIVSIKEIIETNTDLVVAFLIAIPITQAGPVLRVPDFLQACVVIMPVVLAILSLFFSSSKKFVIAALRDKKYAKELYRAFLTPPVSSFIALIFAFFAVYSSIVYFIAIFLLFYSLLSLVDMVLYFLRLQKMLVRYKKL